MPCGFWAQKISKANLHALQQLCYPEQQDSGGADRLRLHR